MATRGRPRKFDFKSVQDRIFSLSYGEVKSVKKQGQVLKELTKGLGQTYTIKIRGALNKRVKELRGIEINKRVIKHNPVAQKLYYTMRGVGGVTAKKAKAVRERYRRAIKSKENVLKAYMKLDVFKGIGKETTSSLISGVTSGSQSQQAFFAAKILDARLRGSESEVEYWQNEYKAQVLEGRKIDRPEKKFLNNDEDLLDLWEQMEREVNGGRSFRDVGEVGEVLTAIEAEQARVAEKQNSERILFDMIEHPERYKDLEHQPLTTNRFRGEMNRDKMRRKKEWTEFKKRNSIRPKTNKPKK